MHGEADPREFDPAFPWGRPGAERVPPPAGRARSCCGNCVETLLLWVLFMEGWAVHVYKTND